MVWSLFAGAGASRSALNMLGHLADLTWALHDMDAALAGFRETVALMRTTQLINRGTLGAPLTSLAGVHTERGEIQEALNVAREGLPLLKEAGWVWEFADHVALRAG